MKTDNREVIKRKNFHARLVQRLKPSVESFAYRNYLFDFTS